MIYSGLKYISKTQIIKLLDYKKDFHFFENQEEADLIHLNSMLLNFAYKYFLKKTFQKIRQQIHSLFHYIC